MLGYRVLIFEAWVAKFTSACKKSYNPPIPNPPSPLVLNTTMGSISSGKVGRFNIKGRGLAVLGTSGLRSIFCKFASDWFS